ncbi:uncharacterized protein [Diadema antillarum]|uniref:uncharacterized protein n=1 Tax=Diadema antillarum TaxID=105358 RepID=UPI003A8A2C2D
MVGKNILAKDIMRWAGVELGSFDSESGVVSTKTTAPHGYKDEREAEGMTALYLSQPVTLLFPVLSTFLAKHKVRAFEAVKNIRLVGGSKPNEGRIEINMNGTWGTLCGHSKDLQIAMVVCRQAGYPGAAMVFGNSSRFGSGTGPVHYNGYMSCIGSEQTLSTCYFNEYKYTECPHSKDAGVVCLEPGYQGCVPDSEVFQGRYVPRTVPVETVDECITQCQADDKRFAAISLRKCLCSDSDPEDFSFGRLTDKNCNASCPGNPRQICGSANFSSVFSTTDGFCDRLSPPANGTVDTRVSRFGTTVNFGCRDGYELAGAKKAQCVSSETDTTTYRWDVPPPKCRGIILGTLAGLLLVAAVMTLVFFHCRKRPVKYGDRKPMHFRTSWSPMHLEKEQLEAEPHTYESASQGRVSFHSSPIRRASTPGGLSEHLYADYDEFHDVDVNVDGDDAILLNSPSQKVPNGRLVMEDENRNSSIMVVNELYNPSSPAFESIIHDDGFIYEVGGDFTASNAAENYLYDEPSLEGTSSSGEHIYEPEPNMEVTLHVDGDPLYSTADYAEVDARDSGVGTMTMDTDLDDREGSLTMVENELYVPADSRGDNDCQEPNDIMVDNVLYQPHDSTVKPDRILKAL